MPSRSPNLAVVLALLLSGAAGCGDSTPTPTTGAGGSDQPSEHNSNDAGGGGTQGRLFGEQGLVLGVGKGAGGGREEGSGLGVNAYLWRGALDTLSFMPLASADPFGGVIITDWYEPPAASGERFKATAYILGRQLRADALRVSIFRQVQQGGAWVDAPVSAETVGEIENKVLARARALRAQSAAS